MSIEGIQNAVRSHYIETKTCEMRPVLYETETQTKKV